MRASVETPSRLAFLWCCRTSRLAERAPPSPVEPPLLEELEPLDPPLDDEPEELDEPDDPVAPLDELDAPEEPVLPLEELAPDELERPPLDEPEPPDVPGAPSAPVIEASSLAGPPSGAPSSVVPHDDKDGATARASGKRKW